MRQNGCRGQGQKVRWRPPTRIARSAGGFHTALGFLLIKTILCLALQIDCHLAVNIVHVSGWKTVLCRGRGPRPRQSGGMKPFVRRGRAGCAVPSAFSDGVVRNEMLSLFAGQRVLIFQIELRYNPYRSGRCRLAHQGAFRQDVVASGHC